MKEVYVKFLRPHILQGGVRCRKGEVREVDAKLLPSLKAYGIAAEVGAPEGGSKGDDGTEGYSSKTKQELVALAEERELEVVRRDGQDGEPVKADYIAALEEADQAPKGDDGTEGSEPKGSAEGEGE